MLPYDLDAPYACLSIKMNGTSGMPFSLKDDLAALPGVEEVSAAIDLTDIYTVTSDKIQSARCLPISGSRATVSIRTFRT